MFFLLHIHIKKKSYNPIWEAYSLPISFGEVTWSLLGLQALFKRFVLFCLSVFIFLFCSVIIYSSYQVTSPRKVMFLRPELKMSKNISSSPRVCICWAWILQHFTAVSFFQWNWEPKPDTYNSRHKNHFALMILSSTVLRHGGKENNSLWRL